MLEVFDPDGARASASTAAAPTCRRPHGGHLVRARANGARFEIVDLATGKTVAEAQPKRETTCSTWTDRLGRPPADRARARSLEQRPDRPRGPSDALASPLARRRLEATAKTLQPVETELKIHLPSRRRPGRVDLDRQSSSQPSRRSRRVPSPSRHPSTTARPSRRRPTLSVRSAGARCIVGAGPPPCACDAGRALHRAAAGPRADERGSAAGLRLSARRPTRSSRLVAPRMVDAPRSSPPPHAATTSRSARRSTKARDPHASSDARGPPKVP